MAVLRELITKISFKLDDSDLTRASKKITRFGKQTKAVGSALTARLTVPAAAAGFGILKAAGNFESGMNRVRVLTGATGEQFERLRNQAKTLGATTTFSATQASDAMGFLAQAGFEVEEIYAAMPATLNLAAASGQDLATTADQMSNIMQGFGLDAEEAARSADVLALASSSSNTDVTQMAEAMKFAAPVAKLMGNELEEAAGIIGFMGNAGIQGTLAGTSLRRALLSLTNLTPRAQKAFDELGVSILDDSGNMRNFLDVLKDLETAGAGVPELEAIFGKIGITGVSAILDQGTEGLDQFIAKLQETAGGTAARQAEDRMKGLNGAMIALKSALEGLAIAIADSGLLKFVTEAVQKFTRFIRTLTKVDKGALGFITILLGISAAIGPLVFGLGTLATSIGAISKAVLFLMANPLVLTITAIVAAVAGLTFIVIRFRKEIAFGLKWIWTAIKNIGGHILTFLKNLVPNLAQIILKSASFVLKTLIQKYTDGFADLVNVGVDAVNMLIKALNLIPGVDIGLIGKLNGKELADNLIGGLDTFGNEADKVLSLFKSDFENIPLLSLPSAGVPSAVAGIAQTAPGGSVAPSVPRRSTPAGGAVSTSINAKVDVVANVPVGTSQAQQDAMRQIGHQSIKEAFDEVLRQAQAENPQVVR